MKTEIRKTELKNKNKFECVVDGVVVGSRQSKHDYIKCFVVRYRKEALIRTEKWSINHYGKMDSDFGRAHCQAAKETLAKFKSGDFGSKLDLQVLSWHKAPGAKPDLGNDYELIATATLS